MTIDRKHWNDAINVQSACNLSGVAHSLSRAVAAIWDEAHAQGKGTQWVNQHPIVVLYVAQLAALSGVAPIADLDAYNKAYTAVRDELDRLSKEEVKP
jgi:hypothetical protein